jgi:hypothetical protein
MIPKQFNNIKVHKFVILHSSWKWHKYKEPSYSLVKFEIVYVLKIRKALHYRI